MCIRRLLIAIAMLALLASCAGAGPAESDPPLGAEGFDVVAYFTEDKAVRGSSEHRVNWDGRVWHFASAEHRRRFQADPERYAPTYDGHCAWAMSQGRLANGRPQHWAIHDGRLFFNCNAEVHARWLKDPETLIRRADRVWEAREGS